MLLFLFCGPEETTPQTHFYLSNKRRTSNVSVTFFTSSPVTSVNTNQETCHSLLRVFGLFLVFVLCGRLNRSSRPPFHFLPQTPRSLDGRCL
ncbi:hypothetical protein JOB18_039742 [Solea senegalensis]|uniref:Uncharacterized protein n=1 Tax=Solea senegalensis TaxID=28829 RepID=A0AAV6QXJ8_SOLSE|nr:hypothetical protein JOB18_039742 [Solea senegalensis]